MEEDDLIEPRQLSPHHKEVLHQPDLVPPPSNFPYESYDDYYGAYEDYGYYQPQDMGW